MNENNQQYSFLARFLFVCVLLLGSVLVFLVLLELGLRMFYPQELEHTVYDSLLNHRAIPNEAYVTRNPQLFAHEFAYVKRTNSQGYDDTEHTIAKGNAKRIAVIGDSFIACGAVPREACVTTKLAEELLKKTNQSYEILNFGVGSYSMDNYNLLLKNEVINYSPDIVVIASFLGNDFDGDELFVVNTLSGNYSLNQVSAPEPSSLFSVRRFLGRHLHSYRFLVNLLSHSSRMQSFLVKLGLFYPTEIDMFGLSSPQQYKERLQKALLILEDTALFLKEKNIPFLLVLIPPREQVQGKTGSLSHANPQKDLLFFAAQKNISVLDLLPLLQEKNKNVSLYYAIDGHWNAEGHREAAVLIAKDLHQ